MMKRLMLALTASLLVGSTAATAQEPSGDATALLPPEGSWQVTLSAADLPDGWTPGAYTWTFEGDRAALELPTAGGRFVRCTADAKPVSGGVSLVYDRSTPCEGEVDRIRWALDDDGLHLGLILTNVNDTANRVYLETKPWEPVDHRVSTEPPDVVRYVAFGDSWPAGGHCDGCRTFAWLWADALSGLTGREVEVTDLMADREPGIRLDEYWGTSTSLLMSLRFNPVTREATRAADVILIATGANEMGLVFEDPPADGDCAGPRQVECVEALGRLWMANFDAILDEVELLREGRPTVVRLVDAGNPFPFDADMAALLGDDLGPTKGARIFELLDEAMCAAAAAHDAACVDVRPIINGPSLDQPGDENAPEVMRAITDALVATGVDELAQD